MFPSTFTLPLALTDAILPTEIARAGKYPTRVGVKNLSAAPATVVLSTVWNNLLPGSQNGYQILGINAAADVFVLMPGDVLYAINLVGSPALVNITVQENEGTLLGDVYMAT